MIGITWTGVVLIALVLLAFGSVIALITLVGLMFAKAIIVELQKR